MAAFDFPASPTLNQVYTPAGGPTYTWNGVAWVTISAGIPDAPSDGALYGRASSAWAKGVKLAGDTMTGNLTISRASGSAGVVLRAAGVAYDTAVTQETDGSACIWNSGARFQFGTSGAFLAPGPVYSTESVVIKAASANANLLLQNSSGTTVHAIFSTPSAGSINFYNTITNAYHRQYSDGGFETSHNWASKPGGGPWADSSDARIKNVHGDYTAGLAEIAALRPVIYQFKGNDLTSDPGVPMIEATDSDPAVMPKSPHAMVIDKTFIGLIAQEVEIIFPEMVTQREAWVDGKKVTDLRDLDTSALIYALVNAVKELKARVEELEARP